MQTCSAGVSALSRARILSGYSGGLLLLLLLGLLALPGCGQDRDNGNTLRSTVGVVVGLSDSGDGTIASVDVRDERGRVLSFSTPRPVGVDREYLQQRVAGEEPVRVFYFRSGGRMEATMIMDPTVVEGLVMNVASSGLTQLTSLDVRDGEGRIWHFEADGFVGMTPSHLREHQLTGEPVRVFYDTQGERLKIRLIEDA